MLTLGYIVVARVFLYDIFTFLPDVGLYINFNLISEFISGADNKLITGSLM